MRAQATLEFLVLAAVLLMLFIAIMETYLNRLGAGEDFQQRVGAQRISDDAARHISRVHQSGNSSRIQLRLPSLLPTGQNYSLAVVGRRLDLTWDSKSVSTLLLTANLSGTLTPGVVHNLTNVNGGVVIAPS